MPPARQVSLITSSPAAGGTVRLGQAPQSGVAVPLTLTFMVRHDATTRATLSVYLKPPVSQDPFGFCVLGLSAPFDVVSGQGVQVAVSSFTWHPVSFSAACSSLPVTTDRLDYRLETPVGIVQSGTVTVSFTFAQ